MTGAGRREARPEEEKSPSGQRGRSRGSVLIVDDEAYVRDSLVAILERRGFDTREAATAPAALERLEGLDAVVLDLKMPSLSGDALLPRILEREPSLPVVMLTGHGTVASAVHCMQNGACDYLLKPADPDELVLVLERAISQSSLQREVRYLRRGATAPPAGSGGPLGDSAPWRRAMELVELVAPTDSSVLLLGESGTGKEVLAKEIHRRSLRADAPFVQVNCAAVPESLFESEFFGHRRGAFTGADTDREGRFRIAHGGTLLLDEVDSLPPAGQAKVLRVLQDGTFERVGDSKPTRVDVRLICATNADLAKAVEEGRFRADLFYRIQVMPIVLPPLRERPGDVEILARAFLAELAPRLGKTIRSLHPAVLEALDSYPWPGNVRELRNVIERGALLEGSDQLTPPSVPMDLGLATLSQPRGRQSQKADTGIGDDEDLDLRRSLARAERLVLMEALRRSQGLRREAAALLGIDPRNLAYYLKKHDLTDSDR